MTRSVFVTGATGFLGTALAERLVAAGDRVRGLVRRTARPETVAWLERLGVERVEGDLESEGLPAALAGSDLVVHCAARIGYRPRWAASLRRTNVLGTRALAAACLRAGVGRLVHVSSVAAVGVTDTPVLMDEDTSWNASSLRAAYFGTKHEAEEEVQRGVAAGLDATIVNPGAIYGASVVPANSSRILRRIARGGLLVVPPGGINVVPLPTALDGILAAAARGRAGRRYLLGGENLHVADLVRRVGSLLGRRREPWVAPAWLGPPLRRGLERLDPFVPERAWFPVELCALFGRWLWFDAGRAERELGVVAGDLDATLAAALRQITPRRS